MKDETRVWMEYAQENLESSKILLESMLFNPCLENVQQSVEKAIKAYLIERNVAFRKTHSIKELNSLLLANKLNVRIEKDECSKIDMIYMPSRYPLGSVLAGFNPDEKFCKEYIKIAEKVFDNIKQEVGYEN